MMRKGFSLVEVSLSLGILIVAGAAAYYFLYILPQQNGAGSIDVKVTPPSQSQRAVTMPPQPTAPAAPAQAPVVLTQINKPFVIDNIQYTVQSVANLGSQLTSYSQPSQGKYIQVKFVALNVGTHPEYANVPIDEAVVTYREELSERLEEYLQAGTMK